MKHIRSLAIILLSVLLLLPSSASAQGSTLTLSDYESLLREAHAAAQRRDMPGLRAASERLQSATTVRLPNEQTLSVDNSWLKQSIEVPRPQMDAIEGRLGAQLEALIAAHDDNPEALQRLQEIVGQPPFTPDPPDDPADNSWLEDLLDGIAEVIGDIFEAIGMGGLAVGEALLSLVALITLGVGIFFIGRLFRGSLLREKRLKKERPAVEADDPTTSVSAAERAQEVASSGDYRTAVRYLYLSTLLWLHERGMLRYDRALTNREVLESVPPGSPLRNRLHPVVSTFDRVWYGHHELDQPTFEQYRQQVSSLREGRP